MLQLPVATIHHDTVNAIPASCSAFAACIILVAYVGWAGVLVGKAEVDFDPFNDHDQHLIFVTRQDLEQVQPRDFCCEHVHGMIISRGRSWVQKPQKRFWPSEKERQKTFKRW